VGGAVAQATSDAVPWLTLCALCVVTLATLRGAPAMQPAQPPA
jgi:hypothetical protein